MQTYVLDAAQRRMLLEMLASERAGEDRLRVGSYFGRDAIADTLCACELAGRVDPDDLVFTHLGRHIAETLARRLIHAELAADLCC